MDQDAAASRVSAPRLVFFDLDGTIARHDTLLPYVARFLLRRPWRWWRLVGVLPALLVFCVGRGDRGELKGAVIHAAMAGLSREQIEAWNARLLPGMLGSGLFPGALAAIEAHRRSGDHLVLMSASVDLYVPEIGRRLGFHTTVCSQVAWTSEGLLDGRLRSTNCRDAEKARWFRQLAADFPDRPTAAYGNSASDIPHMLLATRAVMVNPSSTLRAHTEARGIDCVRW